MNDTASPADYQRDIVAWRYKDARGHWRYRGPRRPDDSHFAILKPEPLYAASPRETESQWRAIATAPKDGRWMLLGSFVSCFMGHWDHAWKDQRDALRDPTHWMRWPEAPRG